VRALAVAIMLASPLSLAVPPGTSTARAPAFAQSDPAAWLNSPPLTWDALRGHVTLVEFWTFACWNCYRSIPWLRTLEPKYGSRGFRIVSVHTPEFERERVRANVEAQLREHQVTWPVMLDNDYATWNAWGNRYWPAFYLVDAAGRVRAHWAGETHAGDRNAAAMEATIEALLGEH
jgi:hypothetical protein